MQSIPLLKKKQDKLVAGGQVKPVTYLTGPMQAFRGKYIFIKIRPFCELRCTLNCLRVILEHCTVVIDP